MSKSDYLEAEILALLFNADPIPNLADNASTSPLTQLYVSLHESALDDTSTQVTGETAYTNYVRVGVARTAGGWTLTGNSISPVADIDFATVGAGTGTITHVGIGVAASGAGQLLYHGALSPSISYSAGTTPKVTAGSTITED